VSPFGTAAKVARVSHHDFTARDKEILPENGFIRYRRIIASRDANGSAAIMPAGGIFRAAGA
jgi:hypothetical protein